MEENIETGGPAFPCHAEIIPHRDHDFAGMTLRDYFAAKAMQGLIGETPEMMHEIATSAYQQADAMIKAREAA